MDNFKEKIGVIEKSIREEFRLTNLFEVPKITKVVVSSGVGNFKDDDKRLKDIESALSQITGQKPKVNKSRKSVSAFKLRENQIVGYTVTLRGKKMYDFLSVLANSALPRVRDFKGISKKGFDASGNYSLGISEHTIMPVVRYEDVTQVFGFQVNIRIKSKSKDMSKALLNYIGFTFEKE